MNDLFDGLVYGKYIGYWIAGVAIALALLTRGWSLSRGGAFAALVLWPVVPIALAMNAQQEAQSAADRFSALCEKSAYEKIHRKSEPISEIFVEGSSWFLGDALFQEYGREIQSRLVLERPGYDAVHVVERKPVDGAKPYTVKTRGTNTTRKATDDAMAQYGVKFAFEGPPHDSFVRQFHVQVLDRKTHEVLAEQRSYLYRSTLISIGGYPLWHAQQRSCPLGHPADFVRSALVPSVARITQ